MSTDAPASRKFVFRREKGSGKAKKIMKTNEVSFTECQISRECGSCQFINLPYQENLQKKFQQSISKMKSTTCFEKSRFVDPVESPKNLAFKLASNLLVRPPLRKSDKDRFSIGNVSSAGQAFDLGACPINEIAIGRFIRALRFHLNQSPLDPWNVKTNSGDLSAVELKASHITKELMVTFSVTNPCKQKLKQVISLLRFDGHKINSAHMKILTDGNNHTDSKCEIVRIAGTDKLRDSFCDTNVETGPSSDFSSNPWQSINLHRRIEQIVGTSSTSSGRAWEINCSTGVLSMLLARSGYKVVGFDNNEANILDANANLVRNNFAASVKLYHGEIQDFSHEAPIANASADTLIVHSGKKGLSNETLNFLTNELKNSPSMKIIYDSENLDNMISELTTLCSNGRSPRQIEAFDFKAQTDQLTWLAIITPN